SAIINPPMTRSAGAAGLHLAAALLFLTMSVGWTWPLLIHLSSTIPGTPGDNLGFVWNDWWMRTALQAHVSPFRTDRLFQPNGMHLTVHTHTGLLSWISATLLSPLSIVSAHNTLILIALATNGLAAYALAWDRVGRLSHDTPPDALDRTRA